MPYKDREQQRAAQRESARRRRAKAKLAARGVEDARAVTRSTKEAIVVLEGEPLLPADWRIQTAHDLLDELSEQWRAVRDSRSADELMKARVLAQLAGPTLRAAEVCREADAEAQQHLNTHWLPVLGQAFRQVLNGLELSDEQKARVPGLMRDAFGPLEQDRSRA